MSAAAHSRTSERFARTFYGRLLLGELIVVGSLLLTVLAVMLTVAPSLFNHYLFSVGPLPDIDLQPVELAFTSSLWISLVTALLVAAAAAVVLALVIVRPLRRQLREFNVVAQQVAAGDFSRRVVLSRDAGSEVTVLASNLNAMAEQLGEADEARRRLLADLAHELRTPLASLAVTLEALGDGVLEPDEAAYATLSEQTRRLTRLASDLRSISDAHGGLSVVTAPVELKDLVEHAGAEMAKAFQRAGVSLEVGDVPKCQLLVDSQRISQVLTNLLSNALRHTPASGRVRLSARVGAAAVEIEVADDGDGIDAKHLPFVFDRFYRTDTARTRDAGGTGIGLSVSVAIAAAHGGTLTAASKGEGHGSSFTLTLPLQS